MSRNAFPALEREYNEREAALDEARARLAEWREFIANAQAPETAESVQASAIAENQARQLPYR